MEKSKWLYPLLLRRKAFSDFIHNFGNWSWRQSSNAQMSKEEEQFFEGRLPCSLIEVFAGLRWGSIVEYHTIPQKNKNEVVMQFGNMLVKGLVGYLMRSPQLRRLYVVKCQEQWNKCCLLLFTPWSWGRGYEYHSRNPIYKRDGFLQPDKGLCRFYRTPLHPDDYIRCCWGEEHFLISFMNSVIDHYAFWATVQMSKEEQFLRYGLLQPDKGLCRSWTRKHGRVSHYSPQKRKRELGIQLINMLVKGLNS